MTDADELTDEDVLDQAVPDLGENMAVDRELEALNARLDMSDLVGSSADAIVGVGEEVGSPNCATCSFGPAHLRDVPFMSSSTSQGRHSCRGPGDLLVGACSGRDRARSGGA